MLSEEGNDEFHVFPETRRRAETIESRYTATKGKSAEIFLTEDANEEKSRTTSGDGINCLGGYEPLLDSLCPERVSS
ncbi:hypothetical protein CEE35_04010 [Candidatus Aerophobetes bacterium Ae_b3b]|nr:MAG: hypothetical protein CEE35_04010 [Candidatus Aerophobetes bacterium Ae_b3b]